MVAPMSSSSPKPAVATEFTARVSRFGGAVFVLFLAEPLFQYWNRKPE